MSEITREEFNKSLARIHDKIDSIDKTGTRIEVSAHLMKEAVDKIYDCIYGNGKDGLTQKMVQFFERISLHTKLISIIIVSIIGLAFEIIRRTLIK